MFNAFVSDHTCMYQMVKINEQKFLFKDFGTTGISI